MSGSAWPSTPPPDDVTKRILLSYLTVTVVVLLILEIPLGLFYAQREADRLATAVERDAAVTATVYEDALERNVEADPAPAEAYAARTGARVVVVDNQGQSVVDTAAPVGRDFSTRPEFKVALDGRVSTGVRRSDTLDTDLLYVAVPVASGGEVHGALRITLDRHEVDGRVRNFWLGLLAIGALVLLAMGGIGWALARSITSPLRTLNATASRFAEGDLQTSAVDASAPPEIAALAVTMNHMAERLEKLLAEQRLFVADASHQLRTPLTALRLRLENLRDALEDEAAARAPGRGLGTGAPIDPDGAPATIADVDASIDEADRLTGLVGDLLRLARADQAADPVVIDLAEAVRDRVDTWAAVAEAQGVVLEAPRVSGAVPVLAVPGGIEQVLDNLLDNAILASPGGGAVTVTVGVEGGSAVLSVTDEGPGLTDEHKARAVERFWRESDSRPGSGLGLPIAAAIVAASGGRLRLLDAEPQGLSVRIELTRP